MTNANDSLMEYSCSDNYYKHALGMLYTDDVKAMAEIFQCYWFLDVIVSYQHELKNEEFQMWKLLKHDDGSATVSCTDGNDGVLRAQEIPYTDFKADEATMWVEFGVILLPSEH
jgi:hypothetical protein